MPAGPTLLEAPPSATAKAAGWAVHLYTATGALTALGGLWAVAEGQITEAFWFLYLAVFVDATDGTLARAARVKQVLPQFDGAKLDDIVDYLTFVIVPLFLMLRTGMLPGTFGAAAAGGAAMASAYRFCSADAKTADHFFTGFPSYWNIVALYFWVLEIPAGACVAITAVLAIFVLVPLRFIYPSRMTDLRGWNVGLGIPWALVVGWMLLRLPERPRTVAMLSLAYPVYYTLASFYLDWRHRRAAAGRA